MNTPTLRSNDRTGITHLHAIAEIDEADQRDEGRDPKQHHRWREQHVVLLTAFSRQCAISGCKALFVKSPALRVLRGPSLVTDGVVGAVEPDGLPAQRKTNRLKLSEKHVELGQLRFACAGQVACRDVDDLMWIAEVRGAHVFRIGIRA